MWFLTKTGDYEEDINRLLTNFCNSIYQGQEKGFILMDFLKGIYKIKGSGEVNQKPSTKELHFHTLFKEEFSGFSAKEVIQALYENSKVGMGDISFDSWWEYQTSVCKLGYNLSLPAHQEPKAFQKLLDILVNVGALEQGTLPEKKPNNKVSKNYG